MTGASIGANIALAKAGGRRLPGNPGVTRFVPGGWTTGAATYFRRPLNHERLAAHLAGSARCRTGRLHRRHRTQPGRGARRARPVPGGGGAGADADPAAEYASRADAPRRA